jgi:dihydrodipicolinate synthase/N-acetylneuraminate lyase
MATLVATFVIRQVLLVENLPGIYQSVVAPTTSASWDAFVELTIEAAKRRVPVIAGAGSNNTIEAIELATHAEQAGADAVLIVAPYYNKPSPEGIYRHFKAIDAAIGIPIIVYNIPPRSVVDISVDTLRPHLPRLQERGRGQGCHG